MSHHLYEDGDDYNRLYFEVLDANGDYPVENTLNSIKLFAPDGAEITLDTSDWDTASLFYGQYNATTGNYEYASESVFSSYYECRFGDPMPIGEYHLEVIDTEGATHHSYREYDGAATLPMISSDTFRFSLNPDGDFLWTWQAPTGIDPGLETETRAKIKVFENGEAVEEIYVSSIPTDLGELLLPASIVNAMEARGDRFECTLSLRTTNSQNRTITKAVPLNSLSNPPRYTVSGTVAVDGYTGGDIFLKLYDGQIPNQSILLAEAVISEPGSFSLGPLPDMGGINTWFYVVWDQNENGSVGLGDKYGATAFQLYDDFVVPNVPLNDTIDFSVTGGVKNVHEPDGSYSTLLEVEVTDLGSLFGTIPDDIDAVVFEGPSGVLATSGMEFEQYSDDNGWYWIFLPDQQPELGTYTFSVASGTAVRTAMDEQTIIREIPLPDVGSFSPQPGSTISPVTPQFSWDPVSYGNTPLYYRLQIRDADGKDVVRTPRTLDMTSHTVPGGILLPDQTYSWRVRVSDSGDWLETENRSHSDWQSITIASATDDTDEDGVLDVDDAFPYDPAEWADHDADGVGDNADRDDDNDGYTDDRDAFPLDAAEWLDTNGNGTGDNADGDDDGDGVLDTDDNCPLTANPDQADGDGDGIGDVCEALITVDGEASDWAEITPVVAEIQGESLCADDTDFYRVYTATDALNAYVMIETHGQPISDTAAFEAAFDFEPGRSITWQSLSDLIVNLQMNAGTSFLYAHYDPDLSGETEHYPITGHALVRGNVLELSIPLSELGSPDYFTFVGAKSHTSDWSQQCDEAVGPNQIRYMFVSHHIWEDGQDYNRLYFSLYDADGNYPVEDTVSSIRLFAPDGSEITLDTRDWETTSLLYGQYNAAAGSLEFASQPVFESYYFCRFSDPLPAGEYHLEVIDTTGAVYHGYSRYDGAATLPIIDSATFRFATNPDGDLVWTWQVPTGIDPGIETDTRAWIKVFENDEVVEEIYVRHIPTDLGEMVLPASIVEAMEARGDRFECLLQLRTANGLNRTYTKYVALNSLSNLSGYTVSGTVAVDGHTGGDIFLKLYDGEDPDQSELLAEGVISAPGSFNLPGIPNVEGINSWLYAVWDQNESGRIDFGDKYGRMSFYINNDVTTPSLPVDQTIDFSVTGGVKNVHEPDGSYSTLLEVEVSDFIFGTIPDDIDAVVFEGPGGELATLAHPDMEFEQEGDDNGWYWIFLPDQQPELGTYTFSVNSGGTVRTVTDTQTIIREIPLPDVGSFSPQPGATVSPVTPQFSWDPVSYGNTPLYYRLQIRDADGNDVVRTPRTLDMTSYTLPGGILLPDQTYSWRVRVSDHDNWLVVENRSHSDWQSITIASATDDTDEDGVLDVDDAFPYDPAEWADNDGDGTGDNADRDDDNDGYTDDRDAFPQDAAEWLNTDGSGTGDNADSDDDNDDIVDSEDNCPLTVNTDQADADGDGIGDACEALITVDGEAADWAEITPVVAEIQGDSLCADDTDLYQVYTATDALNAYMMIETYGQPISDTAVFNTAFDFKPGRSIPWQSLSDLIVNLHMNEGTPFLYAHYDPDLSGETEHYPITGHALVRGSVLELSIPLSELGNPDYFTFVGAESHTSDWSQQCDGAIGPNRILSMIVGHHIREDGQDYNRLYFEVFDDNGNYPVEDPLSDIQLYAPDGAEIALDTSDWIPASTRYGQYNADTGSIDYDSQSIFESYYVCRFSGPLPTGEYHLEATDTEGATHHGYRSYDGAATLPIIDSATFRFTTNPDGDLVWTWQAPTEIDPGLETETRAWIKVFENDEVVEEVYVRGIPTDLGEMVLPASIVADMEASGDRFECLLQLRTANGQNRTYTNAVPLNSLSNLSGYTVSGTVAVDGHTGGDIFLKLYDGEDPDQSELLAEGVISAPGSFNLPGIPNVEGINTWLYAVWDQNESGRIDFGDKYGRMSFYINNDVTTPSLPVDQTIDFSVTGGVKNVHEPDGSYSTLLEVEVSDFIFGTIPDDIDDVVFEGPGGELATLAHPDMEFEQEGDDNGWYWIFLPDQQPELGTYTFSVASGTAVRTATDEQTIIREIPLPDVTSFSPQLESTVSSMTPLFSWDPVSYGNTPLYYRLQIRDADGNDVVRTPRTLDMTSYTVPGGILLPEQTYSWRVRVSDSEDWLETENRSHCEWQPFTMASALDHPAMPVVDLADAGVSTISQSTGAHIDMYVKVIDHDGVTDSSHIVVATPPEGAGSHVSLNFDYSENGKVAYYNNSIDPGSTPLDDFRGDWTFTVTDPAGNETSTVDTLVVAPLPSPIEDTFQPTDGITLADTTPTFSWATLSGENAGNVKRYRVRIYTDDLSRTVWRGYVGTETSYTVPPGVLDPGTTYRYRIDAWDAHIGFDKDNVSHAPADSANYLRFTTGTESPDPYIELGNSGVETWSNNIFGSGLEINIKVHDPQGVPGNIASVKAILPDGREVPLRYDHNESATLAAYRAGYFETLTSGTYTLQVEDRDGNTYETTEELNSDPIGAPAESTFLPLRSTLIGSTAVNFNWEDVAGAAFYRVEIYDEDFNRIYRFATTESRFDLPEGYLEEGKYYSYRITTRREFFDENVDNGSSSPWDSSQRFDFVTTASPGSGPPSIETDNWGAMLWQKPRLDDPTSSNYWMAFGVRVTDPDGPPHCIQRVTVIFPDGRTRELNHEGNDGQYTAWYWHMEDIDDPMDMPEDRYIFMVEDVNGNRVTTTDTFTRNVLPLPTSLLPLPDSDVYGTTPIISWAPVAGAVLYRVEIYDESGSRIHHPHLTETAYTVPAGILELDQTYSYRVRAYREDFNEGDMDNLSSSMWYGSLRPHFTVRSLTDNDIDGLPDAWEQQIVDANHGDGITAIADVLPDDDYDGDGLSNGDEYLNGSDPTDPDSDDDGFNDGPELTAGSDPNDGASIPTAFTWTGALNIDWQEPNNWDICVAPGSGAYVAIPGGCLPAEHSTSGSTVAIDQLTVSGQLTISGGTVIIGGDAAGE